MSNNVTLKKIEPEYIYITIPAEYICVYHRILAMLADYGEQMLLDCKASCTDRNSGVIECFNMFNAAVAARKLGKTKLAETLIKYIKAKINQIYKGKDNSTSFVFPVDENGQLKAFVSCGERPVFRINEEDMELYEHKFHNGFDEHFKLGPEDDYPLPKPEGDAVVPDPFSPWTPPSGDISTDIDSQPGTMDGGIKVLADGLYVQLTPRYEQGSDGEDHPCADIKVYFNKAVVDVKDVIKSYYFDDNPVLRFDDVTDLTVGYHKFTLVVTYKGETKIVNKEKYYGAI